MADFFIAKPAKLFSKIFTTEDLDESEKLPLLHVMLMFKEAD